MFFAVIWNVLVEVAATLQHAEESIKRQWLLDTLQISCVTSYPSTVCSDLLGFKFQVANYGLNHRDKEQELLHFII